MGNSSHNKKINILIDTKGGHLLIRSSLKLKQGDLIEVPEEEMSDYPYTYAVPNYVKDYSNGLWLEIRSRSKLCQFTDANYLYDATLSYSEAINALGDNFHEIFFKDFYHC